jgi:hypothetical protein
MKKWILYITAFLFATACVSEGVINPDPPQPPVEGGDPGSLTLQLVFPKMNSAAFGTKAFTYEEELRIDSLDVFVFKNPAGSHSRNDTYLYRVSLPPDSIKRHTVLNDTTWRVRLTLKTMPEEGQRLICVANMPHNLTNLDQYLTKDVTTVQDFVERLTFSGSPWHTEQTDKSAYIPMWGEMKKTLTFTPNGTLPEVELITMIRAMAKIEVSDGSNDPALGFGDIFQIDSVYVCNASAEGFIAPDSGYIYNSDRKVLKTNPVNIDDRITCAGFEFDSIMENTIYVPETDTLRSGGKDPAFLVIKARYYDGDPDYNNYYYRIDFANSNELKPLLRNHKYVVNILNIRMKGYLSLDSARAAPPASTNYAVEIGGSGTKPVSPEIMDVSVYKNEYMVGVNTSEVMFDWWKNDWLGKTTQSENDGYQLVLYTDYEGGWKAESDETWLTIKKPGGTFASSASSSVKTSGSSENLEISAGENKSGEERSGKITLTAGLLTKEIIVRQSGGANSIFVRVGIGEKKLRIPLAFADKARAALGLTSMSSTGYSVAWNNNINNLTLVPDGNSLTAENFTLSSNWGNALVVLTAGADTLWSWHVWVVNNTVNINADYHSMNTTSVFMDRLLGSGQVYYQWGRKDPFLPGRYGVEGATTDMIKRAIAHPSTFYIGSNPDFSWAGHVYDQYNNNNMWNDIDGKKTYSDPCPAGWRVPYYQAAQAQTTPWQNERSNLVNYINTGYIAFDDGAVETSGAGFIWSATTAALNHRIYYANVVSTTEVKPFEMAYRGNGYAVRCVKDISRKY